jgi:Na+/H+ antiporter NhaA
VEDILILYPEGYQKRQMISVIISVLALAISFTVNYRENKENSMGVVSTFVYFIYIIMSVVARTLCFEIYAFYLVLYCQQFDRGIAEALHDFLVDEY